MLSYHGFGPHCYADDSRHCSLSVTVACAPCGGGTVQGAAFGGSKYGVLKFGRFWRIGICIADSDILHPHDTPNTVTLHQSRDHTPNCQCSTTPHKAVCTPRNLHCWPDWSFTCCKTVEDPYCPVTVLLALAIQCFALFTCFQICVKNFCKKWPIDCQESL